MALINDFLSLIYPRFCEACDELLYKHEAMLCNACQLNLPKSKFYKDPNNAIIRALGGRVPVKNATSLYVFEKEGRVQQLLHALKYENQQALGVFLGEALYEELRADSFLDTIDFIVPVPLHPNKQRSRGYNQSECFAKGISGKSGIALNTANLIREKETASQTRKRKFERWENVSNVFALTSVDEFKNKHLLLVDDVITTGATIEAVWQSLKDVEGLTVSLASIAYAIK